MQRLRRSIMAVLVAVCAVFMVVGCATPEQVLSKPAASAPVVETEIPISPTAAPPGDQTEPTVTIAPEQDETDVIMMQSPALCKPENPQYTNLSEFWNREIFPAGERAYAEIVYENEYRQKFDIIVEGANDDVGTAAISTYVEEARVCFETMANDAPETLTDDPIDASDTITDPEDLAILATIEETADNIQNNQPSPLGLNIYAGVARPDNWSQAYDRLMVKLAAGDLSESDFTMIEEYASNFGQTEPVFGLLESLKRGELERQDFAEWFLYVFLNRQESVLHFAIDPNIAPGAWHNYRAFCGTRSARVRMAVSQNNVNLYFWRYSPHARRGPSLIRQGTSSGWWQMSWTSPATFDTLVMGGAKPGTYGLNGGWIMGSGCR